MKENLKNYLNVCINTYKKKVKKKFIKIIKQKIKNEIFTYYVI